MQRIMKKICVFGVDFGRGASKASPLLETGDMIAISNKECPLYHPEIGWYSKPPKIIMMHLYKYI